MGNKSILGGKIANAINIHQEALHLSLEPEMMLIMFLMKGHKKFSVIENTRTLLRPLGNRTISGFGVCTMGHTHIASQRISRGSSIWNMNPFYGLHEALMINIVKI